MDKNKQDRLYGMLENMSNYSIHQPKAIENLCKDLFITEVHAPVMDLLVESFLTVYSFSLLMYKGLVSNASAILRILIEQVAILTVISDNSNAYNEYLNFQHKKVRYYGSNGDEHERIKKRLFEEAGCKHNSENALKNYLDYGWIRVVCGNKTERGSKTIIKEARLSELLVDINEQLNAFAHGQQSIFFFKEKNLADKHISRIILVAGKLFLFLCDAKNKLFENKTITDDKSFNFYINAKIAYLDLNARATNSRIISIIKTTDNLDRDIKLSIGTIDHIRGLIYRSELDWTQINTLARAYVIEFKSFLFRACYKLFGKDDKDFFDGVKTFSSLIDKIGLEKIESYYQSDKHHFPLKKLFDLVMSVNDTWGPSDKNGNMPDLDDGFITDLSSLALSLFCSIYPEENIDQITKTFVSID